tara:strand:+ start:280 stop:711 length:432 start_codon:yes stop_codon:yes gene_type:complete
MGPIINTIIGAGIKLGCNLLNHWLEQKKLEIQYLHARDDKIMELVAEQNKDTRSDPFVKVTRRILFMALTFTYCFLMIYYALNPDIKYDVLVPNGASNGIFGWFVGADTFDTVTLTGGLLLMTFTDLIFMVVGFYSIPSKRYR